MKDKEVTEVLKKENEDFKKLLKEHKKLEENLAAIDKKKYHTTDEEIERKSIQKQKLKIKDHMAELIREYKKNKS